MKSLQPDSNRQGTAIVPLLDRGHKYLAKGTNADCVRLIPCDGTSDSWFVEWYRVNGDKGPSQEFFPHGVVREFIPQVLETLGFAIGGEWIERPHNGQDPDYAKCHGWDRHGRRLTGNWHLDDEIEQLLFCSVLAGQRHRRED